MIAPDAYELFLHASVEKELARLPSRMQQRVRECISDLRLEPRPRGCKKLMGLNAYRIRIGDNRVLYRIDDAARQLFVYRIGHRRDVYR